MRSVLFVAAAISFASEASAFSRCRLSADECKIVLDERYRLASITYYEQTLPSRRNPLDQKLFLIERSRARFQEAIAGKPHRIAAEMVRLMLCDTIEDGEVAGYHTGIKEDCR